MTNVTDRKHSFSIRRAIPEDGERLIDIWWHSASATHTFLSTAQLEALLPSVVELQLETLDTWVLCTNAAEAVGFLVMSGNSVDALFVAPEWIGRGGGRMLMRQAREQATPLRVDVNEANVDALNFYLSEGFSITSRSPVDDAGRPYPLLHLAESAK